MANKNKKLTEEQEVELKMLLSNKEMLERSISEAEKAGKTSAAKQIKRALDEVVEHINTIDSSALEKKVEKKKKVDNTASLFQGTDLSVLDFLKDDEQTTEVATTSSEPAQMEEVHESFGNLVQDETVQAAATTFNNVDTNAQYDVIQLPSNGQCYANKLDRVPVAYLTAYDENIITSPNLYKDGLVIDFLLKNKIVNKDINVDELVSGDIDAIILWLRATSYGADFPVVVSDPETGEEIETVLDLTTFKPKDFKLIGDENGWFDFETPIRKDKIKFKYLSRKEEKALQRISELEALGAKAFMLDSERESLIAAMNNDKIITEGEKKAIRAAIKTMADWSKRLKEKSSNQHTNLITNSMLLQIMSVNGNTDKEYIAKFIKMMPARDSLMLRRYINENKPGIDFTFKVDRPESLGGGSFETFLNWDDSVFLNISEL
jgi:hypothetical protein